MADGTEEVVHAIQRLTMALVDAATRLSIMLIERRAERLRLAAQQGERSARAERSRLAGHRAADAAIWRRTADPVWWRKATPEQMSRAWQAASTWHQVDPEAAGARQAMADRLRRRGVEVDTDRTANPGDARWLQTALALAMAEREEQAAYAAERDSDQAILADELLWAPDELPRQQPEQGEGRRQRGRRRDEAIADGVAADEIWWAADELPAEQLAGLQDRDDVSRRAAADLAGGAVDAVIEGELLPALNGSLQPGPDQPGVVNGHMSPALTADAGTPARQQADPPVIEGMVVTAVATEPDTPRPRSDVNLPRMEAMLRGAWPADKAERVLADESWPALASSMQRLDRAGKNVGMLLKDLPIDTTTDVKVPAMLTAWTLRAAAAGPASLRRAVRTREQHLQRTTALRQSTEEWQQETPSDDVVRPTDDVETTSVARLLRTAFPTTTRQSLNRTAGKADVRAGRPGTARDRAAGREPVTADQER